MKLNSKKLAQYFVIVVFVIAFLYFNYSGSDEYNSAPSNIVAESQENHENEYHFKNEENRNKHFEKHGLDMGFKSAEEYEKAASAVVNNPMSLHKLEAEDGDDVYYLESTNEFVIVSTKGYIRTYFYPERGIDYFNSQ